MPDLRPDVWRRLRAALSAPGSAPEPHRDALAQALKKARERQSVPVIWLIGKAQAGKTSIVHALTGSERAEIGSGFRPCTRTASVYDFPPEAPVVRFLDTRGLGEVAYDPAEDIAVAERQAHLLLAVMKAADPDQRAVLEVVRAVRRRHPEWPLALAQTGLHELYPPDRAADGRHPAPYPFACEPWPPDLPADLVRGLSAQRAAWGEVPGSGPVRWVAVDLTLPEDGWEPVDYGLPALWEAITEVSAAGFGERLKGDPSVRDVYDRLAHPHIVGHALSAAGVGALPVVDLVAVPALQARLLHVLAGLYGQTWERRQIGEFLALLGAGIGVAYGARAAGRAVVKLIPGWGQTVGALWGASSAGATTYALGKAGAYYFGNRRRGQDTDAEALRRRFAEAFARGSRLVGRDAGIGGSE